MLKNVQSFSMKFDLYKATSKKKHEI